MSVPLKPKSQPIQVDSAILEGLKLVAAERSAATDGKRVTIRSLAEEAILSHFPDLRLMAQAVTAAVGGGGAEQAAADQVFERLLQVLFLNSGPIAQNSAIEALEGVAVGSFGNEIRLRDLAYHLRSALDKGALIGSMSELVKHYEESGG